MIEKRYSYENTACDLCGFTTTKLLYRMPDMRLKRFIEEFSIVECEHCGHRYLNPRPDVNSISTAYPQTYFANRGLDNSAQKERYLRQASFLPGSLAKVLYVGCAGGGFIALLNDLGYDTTGVDSIESEPVAKDLDIRYGNLPDLQLAGNNYDVVTAWGVLEHLHFPHLFFQEIYRLLKNNGVFIFLVPNADSLWSRWAFKEDVPRHLHFFRKKTLYQYASKSNFLVKKINATNFIYSRPATGKGLFFRQFSRFAGLEWKYLNQRSKRFFPLFLQSLGNVLDLLVVPKIEERIGMAGSLLCCFRKNEGV